MFSFTQHDMRFEKNQFDVDEVREERYARGAIITRSIRTASIRKKHTSTEIKYRQGHRSPPPPHTPKPPAPETPIAFPPLVSPPYPQSPTPAPAT